MAREWERGLSRQEVDAEVKSAKEELDEYNRALRAEIDKLETILVDGVNGAPGLTYDHRYPTQPGRREPTVELPEPSRRNYVPREPSSIERIVPGWQARRRRRVNRADEAYEKDRGEWRESRRRQAQAQLEAEAALRDRRQKSLEIDALKKEGAQGTQGGVEDYVTDALDRSSYAVDLRTKVRYLPSRSTLLVETEFPLAAEAVPPEIEFKYIRDRHAIEPKLRSEASTKSFYRELLAGLTLRVIYECFAVDVHAHIDRVAFNGYTRGHSAATGKPVKPLLVSLQVNREEFLDRDFEKLNPVKALQSLRANFSISPVELVPVTPTIEFDIDDPRFIDEQDILSGLNDGMNLVDLTPAEFEQLITNLFNAMGFEAYPTRTSKDGGVDCIAYYNDPVKGGKYVVQAKRWTEPIQVDAVRDLAGAMDHERASNGILVTTSNFASGCGKFAEGKPIRLFDGKNLLSLIDEYTDIKARIVMPRKTKKR